MHRPNFHGSLQRDTVQWSGLSGDVYTFTDVVPISYIGQYENMFPEKPGIYIFAKHLPNGRWSAVYIGETGNLRTRVIPTHEKLSCVDLHDATHVHYHVDGFANQVIRRGEEQDLILLADPPCNEI